MKILIDMNLSPDWVGVLTREGWQTLHWSKVGDPRARDSVIMKWARDNGYVVFTHDLDLGALLAATRAIGPSVIQVRAQDIMPGSLSVD
jgi:predicted nuclease of predicted toxin-antitoxin system